MPLKKIISFLYVWTAAFLVPPAVSTAAAETTAQIALYGSPKYTGNWQHFDYADPQARKGGRIVFPAYGTFDNFNPFIFKGIAARLPP